MITKSSDGWIYQGNLRERYILGQSGIRNMLVIGVNPSTAVPEKDDPAIRKVRKITRNSGYDGWIMGNLYPAITPRPDELPDRADPKLTAQNFKILKELQEEYRIDAVWAAWGDAIDIRDYLGEALYHIQDLLDGDFQWYVRDGLTKKGNPRHPLYMKEEGNFNWFPVFDYASMYVVL